MTAICEISPLKVLSDPYGLFLSAKTHYGADRGFDPLWMPAEMFPFQTSLTEWALRKGRAAAFADCGMGKTRIQLAWAENVRRHTGGRLLILTPLAVAFQTVAEGERIGVEVVHRREGIRAGDGIVVTNYERLHHFRAEDFAGVVADESSILKNCDGVTRQAVTEFMRRRPYRLLCTATCAPNDYVELGTSSEALGELGFADMLARFFRKSKRTHARRDEREAGLYCFRGHAERHFWRWVCSWARAARRPSDLGFSDEGFELPALLTREHVVTARSRAAGLLFELPAADLREQREELRRTLGERCEQAAELHNAHPRPGVAWCHLNDEARELTRLIHGAVEVNGADPDERKEEVFAAFARGEIRKLVTKPTIAGFGLNWQHCAHQSFFPSHSYEQFYQAVRRSWRFGQEQDVTVDVISTEGQAGVLANLKRKAEAADRMFAQLVVHMREEMTVVPRRAFTSQIQSPAWL